jgi:hypothetical protein
LARHGLFANPRQQGKREFERDVPSLDQTFHRF